MLFRSPDKKVFLDCKEVQDGDDVHLELGDTEGSDFQLITPNLNYQWFNDGVTITTDDDSTHTFKVNPKIKNRIRLKGDKGRQFYFNNGDFSYNFNREDWRQKADSFKRESRKMMERYQIDADKIRRDAQKLRESYGFQSLDNWKNSGKSQKEMLENMLKNDGFLKDGKKKYKVELTDKKLKINGQEMSSEMHQRYLDLLSNGYVGSFKLTYEENND